MVRRTLPPEEWDRLTDPATRSMLPVMRERPTMFDVVVVEHDGQIVASWLGIETRYMEGVYVDPAFRGQASVVFALIAEMKDAARKRGHVRIVTTADNAQIARLCRGLGADRLDDADGQPLAHYTLSVEE